MRPGTVGICANDTGRFTIFTASLAGLNSPPGSQIAWAQGSDIVNSRNLLVEQRFHGDWIWFMDDDHAFDSDLLIDLLKHDVDVVAPMCLMRQEPFYCTAKESEEKALRMTSLPLSGLREVWSTGTAAMLVKRTVFERVAARWPGPPFEHGDVSEDYLFCARLRELGIPIHVDLGRMIGHCTTAVIWPGEAAGSRCIDFQVSDSYLIQVGVTSA